MTDPLYQETFHPHLLARALEHDPESPCIYFEEEYVSRRTMKEAVGRYITEFAALGLGPNDRIAILSDNRPEVLYVLWAVTFLRCVHAALHPMGSVDDYVIMLEDAAIDTIVFAPGAHGAKMRELEQRFPGRFRLLSLGPSPDGVDLIAAASVREPAPLEPPALDGSEVYKFIFTGGTTGRPKAVCVTYTMVRTMSLIQMTDWEWPGEIRQLVCAPLSHSGAPLFLPTLLRGGYIHLLPKFDALAVMKAIQDHQLNCALFVPTMIYALLDHPDRDTFDLSSLETIFYGASAIAPARLQEAMERFGQIFFQFYGQAEAPMTMVVMRRKDHRQGDLERLASCGRPVPWVELKVLDAEGNPVADGEPGEICVRGTLVMPGYLDRPELTAETLRGGWLHTGDLATRDQEGFLRIVGRTKDMIITGGFNVYSREVENALDCHPAVATSAVFGVPHERWGESVVAAVVLRDGQLAIADDLIAHVRQLKGSVQAPKQIMMVAALPLTAVGKPDKKALQEQYIRQSTPLAS